MKRFLLFAALGVVAAAAIAFKSLWDWAGDEAELMDEQLLRYR